MNCLLLVVLAAAAPGAAPTSVVPSEEAALRQARELLRKTPLVDGQNDTAWLIREDAISHGVVELYDLRKPGRHETDLARLRAGGVSAQFWSVWIPSVDAGSARLQLEQIDVARRMIAAYPEVLVFATRAS
ncbi:MAG: membrane dipeptidase [Myxococcaceae bacterium]